jgi:hypothetical protein
MISRNKEFQEEVINEGAKEEEYLEGLKRLGQEVKIKQRAPYTNTK